MPRQLAHHANRSCSSGVRAITAPPTTSLWPLMYLVVECTTASAPKSVIGVCSAGDRKVLSTTASAPARCAASMTKRRSVTRSSGLDGVSIHTTLGAGSNAAASARGSVRSASTSRSDEHTSELQSLMRISYAVFCLKQKKQNNHHSTQ